MTVVWQGAVPPDTAISESAADYRLAIDALVANEGVSGANHFKVRQRQAGANFTVDVGGIVDRDLALIAGDVSPGQGMFALDQIGAVSVGTFPVAPSSGTLHHLVYLKVNDKQGGGGDTGYGQTLAFAADTGGGRPNVATIKNAIPLAEVQISQGQSSILDKNIIDLRPLAKAVGVGAGPAGEDHVYTGTTDGSAWINLPHTLGRKPAGCTATINGPVPQVGAQGTHVSVDISASTSSYVRARVWQLNPYFVWPNKAVTIGYRVF